MKNVNNEPETRGYDDGGKLLLIPVLSEVFLLILQVAAMGRKHRALSLSLAPAILQQLRCRDRRKRVDS